MKTVARLTAECELMNLHQYLDANGDLRGCAGSCLGNDETTAIGNYAGDQVRIICTCECHDTNVEQEERSVQAEPNPTNVTCLCPSERCVCQGGVQCACACSLGIDPKDCVCSGVLETQKATRMPAHEEYCAGCYEVEAGIFIHPPRRPRGNLR